MLTICNGMGRSGSTWQYNVTRRILETVHGIDVGRGSYEVEVITEEQFTNTLNNPYHHVIKMHDVYPRTLLELDSPNLRLLYIYRDLRDVAASVVTKWQLRDEELMETMCCWKFEARDAAYAPSRSLGPVELIADRIRHLAPMEPRALRKRLERQKPLSMRKIIWLGSSEAHELPEALRGRVRLFDKPCGTWDSDVDQGDIEGGLLSNTDGYTPRTGRAPTPEDEVPKRGVTYNDGVAPLPLGRTCCRECGHENERYDWELTYQRLCPQCGAPYPLSPKPTEDAIRHGHAFAEEHGFRYCGECGFIPTPKDEFHCKRCGRIFPTGDPVVDNAQPHGPSLLRAKRVRIPRTHELPIHLL